MTAYAVCKNGRCAQTYSLDSIIKGRSEEVFMSDIRITKGYKCEKCGNIVVEPDGTALLSANPTILKFITIEELEKNEKEELKQAKSKLKKAQKEYNRLKKENE